MLVGAYCNTAHARKGFAIQFTVGHCLSTAVCQRLEIAKTDWRKGQHEHQENKSTEIGVSFYNGNLYVREGNRLLDNFLLRRIRCGEYNWSAEIWWQPCELRYSDFESYQWATGRSVKADSHIPCRSHSISLPLPSHYAALLRQCWFLRAISFQQLSFTKLLS
jgi:hypothetical protein